MFFFSLGKNTNKFNWNSQSIVTKYIQSGYQLTNETEKMLIK